MPDSGTMVAMLQRTLDRLRAPEANAPFLPLAFRLYASFGLLVLHAVLPPEGRASGPGGALYLILLLLLLLESAWEAGRGLKAMGQLFPTPKLPWIRWNLALDLALVTLVIAYQGVMQERFSTLYIFPVLASAFYLGTVEIVWVGILCSITHVSLVLGFTSGILPPFGLSGGLPASEAGRLPFLLGLASLQVFTTTLVVVLIRRHLDRLRTDLRVSEATVGELSALHRRVVESMTSGLITMDLEGRVTSANPAAEAILGRSIPPGEDVKDFLPLDDALPLHWKRDHRFEVVLRQSGPGRRVLGGHLASLRGGAGREIGHLLLFQDLTELKALEDRTRINERMAAIGHLAAGLAHELRNPLASISGCVQLLHREQAPGEVSGRVLGILDRETQRLGAIVTDFLDFARPQPPAPAVLFLPQVLDEVRASWEMDPRAIGIELSIGEVPPIWFRSDPMGLHRVLMNLLTNARKAVKGVPHPSVKVEVVDSGNDIRLTVADNGCGMTPEQLDRLFVPFAGSFEEGSGLGMSLVYKFTEAMGWKIGVDSVPKEGTRIEISFPPHVEQDPMATESEET